MEDKMNKLKKLVVIMLISFLGVTVITGCASKNDAHKYTIVATSFPGYDFARAIVKDSKNIEVKMLLKPGGESHTYEPTPEDIKLIKRSQLFIYVGGDSDEWVSKILNNVDKNNTQIVKLIDLVDTKEEVLKEGMESDEEDNQEEAEIDEHVWTSPKNAIEIVNKLENKIEKIDQEDKKYFVNNAKEYINKLNSLDKSFKKVIKNSKRKEIIVGDRFPLRYFVEEYGLDYYAAFPGCSEQTEASANTISFLVKKVKQDQIPVVLKIELSSGNIAKTISKETNTKVLEFNSAHNITQKDFDAGITYIDLMKKNLKVLEEALN